MSIVDGLPTKTAKGQTGQFWAIVDGIKYPTIGQMRTKWDKERKCLHYQEQYGPVIGQHKYMKTIQFFNDIWTKQEVILCAEKFNDKTGVYERNGYIGGWRIKNIKLSDQYELEFDLYIKIFELK